MKNRGRALRAVAVAAAAGLVAALAAGATDASASPGTGQQPVTTRTAAAPVPVVLRWKACYRDFQCATARVPLDYRHPGGVKISIAVVRHLATDPARRLGSLFVNGGAPCPRSAPSASKTARHSPRPRPSARPPVAGPNIHRDHGVVRHYRHVRHGFPRAGSWAS